MLHSRLVSTSEPAQEIGVDQDPRESGCEDPQEIGNLVKSLLRQSLLRATLLALRKTLF